MAVIGNGCSAAQIVPQIAADVRQLHVFQRSAKWIIPKWDRQFGPVARWVFRRFPWSQKVSRILWSLLADFIAYSPMRPGLFARAVEAVAHLHLRRQIADRALRSTTDSEVRARVQSNDPLE